MLCDYGLASGVGADGDGAPIFTPEFPKADPYLFGKGARCAIAHIPRERQSSAGAGAR